ncbi:hypothetical protein GCM10011571_23290 [Marinithermofilum abyssi]|uniref:YugN-like family protein n=1 Tax=Marinithermofilum abyssi TaxID=1571185 RepID=A0A8J2VI98_9BACL|nr:YugN family protein [Marinithermofilum abyssi]GGE20655.1 hypothetical protein GCM10011571_23290 [Marinithermofilum abyssi]
MIPLDSPLENQQGSFRDLDTLFNAEGFVLGGGYEYDHGYYDKALDWEENMEHRAYLRIPVFTESGNLGENDATIRIGKPFALKHEYQSGLDDHVDTGVISGLIDQFQEPADKDADVEEKWLQRAQSELQQLEHRFLNAE